MIEVQNVTKKYGPKRVLDQVSFTVKQGEVASLIGINGVGKTTLLKAIMGLTPINKGQIRVLGEPITYKSYEHITFIPDSCIMPIRMTTEAAIQFMEDFYPNWNTERANELLTFFKLNKSERLGNLSKGNLAKANLVFGLGLDVEFVLMDEPFSGIDLFSREQIAEVFTSELVESCGVLLTTHEIHEMEHLIDKAILLNNGEVTREFYTEEMREQEGKSLVDIMREAYKS